MPHLTDWTQSEAKSNPRTNPSFLKNSFTAVLVENMPTIKLKMNMNDKFSLTNSFVLALSKLELSYSTIQKYFST